MKFVWEKLKARDTHEGGDEAAFLRLGVTVLYSSGPEGARRDIWGSLIRTRAPARAAKATKGREEE